MCKFFSFVGDGYGNFLYSDWSVRKALIDNKSDDSPDSHTWILTGTNVPANMQDRWSKYEYNPLTTEFTLDEPVEGHDHEAAENWVNTLNFKNIVPALVTKKIKNPLNKVVKVTEADIALLKEWASVGDSVGDSVWASVGDSVGASVWASVWASVGASVWASIWASVGDSVWDSVWASVGDSVWDSVWASVWAYTSSFVEYEYEFDFSSCVKLYERGFVPSFDGTTWRLHTGKNAKVVYELTKG